jgi:hypothetical protein
MKNNYLPRLLKQYCDKNPDFKKKKGTLALKIANKIIEKTEVNTEEEKQKIKGNITRYVNGIFKGTHSFPKLYLEIYIDCFHEITQLAKEDLRRAYSEDYEIKENNGILGMNISDDEKTYEIPLKPSSFIISKETIKEESSSIHGRQRIADKILSMIKGLPNLSNKEPGEIIITFQGQESVFETKEQKYEWISLKKQAIEYNYSITHVVRIDESTQRAVEIVENLVTFANYGKKYQLKILKDESILFPAYGFVIVKGREGLLAIQTEDLCVTDSGVYSSEHSICNIWEKHCEQIIKQSRDIIKFYDYKDYARMAKEILDFDKIHGKRFIYLRRLSEITRPVEWYEVNNTAKESSFVSRIKADHRLDGEELIEHLKIRKERRLLFEEHLEINDLYSINYESTIEKFIVEPHYDNNEKIEMLNSILNLLKYKNYHMALIDDLSFQQKENLIQLEFLEILQGSLIFMEISLLDENGGKEKAWYLIKNSTIANAFREYFLSIWCRIGKSEKNVQTIREKIKTQIRKIEISIQKQQSEMKDLEK